MCCGLRNAANHLRASKSYSSILISVNRQNTFERAIHIILVTMNQHKVELLLLFSGWQVSCVCPVYLRNELINLIEIVQFQLTAQLCL